jgi:lipopolysaccharide transport system permease protein
VSILPLPLQRLFHLNPLTFFIDQARRTVLAGLPPDFGALAIAAVAGLVFAWLGHAWFKATQRGFADVL